VTAAAVLDAAVVLDEGALDVDFWSARGPTDDVLAMRSKVAARSDQLKHVFERHAGQFWFLSDPAGRHSLRRSIECLFDVPGSPMSLRLEQPNS
jgi:hypothetical protein